MKRARRPMTLEAWLSRLAALHAGRGDVARSQALLAPYAARLAALELPWSRETLPLVAARLGPVPRWGDFSVLVVWWARAGGPDVIEGWWRTHHAAFLPGGSEPAVPDSVSLAPESQHPSRAPESRPAPAAAPLV